MSESGVARKTGAIVTALLALYFIWGSTYLGMRWAIAGMAPLFMAAVRYAVAGGLIFVFLYWRGHALPTLKQWRNAGIVGMFLLLGGNGGVALAMEQGVNSALSATVVALMPLMAALLARYWGQKTTPREWLGLGLGVVGVLLLKHGHGFDHSPLGFLLLLVAALSWAFGSMWGKHQEQPSVWMASAVQMLVGSVALFAVSALKGEVWAAPSTATSFYALLYLIFVGAILGFSSYVYLLATVRPALATSYAYVNPVVAVLIGLGLGGEVFERTEVFGLAVILLGVVLVCWPVRQQRR